LSTRFTTRGRVRTREIRKCGTLVPT
jgi:hypothetical protein